MKTIQLGDATQHASLVSEIAKIVKNGGLVCMPCSGSYRVIADLEDVDAVQHLTQAKGRVRRAPALVFISSSAMLPRVTEHLDPLAKKLADEWWPGPLTIRVEPSDSLPSKVVKELGGRKIRIGVRVPADSLVRAVVEAVGGPLLVSSANREGKAGAGSAAQVRKNFGRRAELFVDGGDLVRDARSTVIDVIDGKVVIERDGAIEIELLT